MIEYSCSHRVTVEKIGRGNEDLGAYGLERVAGERVVETVLERGETAADDGHVSRTGLTTELYKFKEWCLNWFIEETHTIITSLSSLAKTNILIWACCLSLADPPYC